jgi:hypothetical protein
LNGCSERSRTGHERNEAAGVNNHEEGNKFLIAYLPKYNRQFGVVSAKETDLHRPFKDKKELDRILSIRTERTLRNDFTIARKQETLPDQGQHPDEDRYGGRTDRRFYAQHS